MYQLGERIRATRKRNNITQKQLADILGIKAATFSRYENNEIDPPIPNLCKIASALRVSVDYLCGLESSATMSTIGLTSEQKALLENVSEQFRKNNRPAKKMTDEQCALIGRIVEEFIK